MKNILLIILLMCFFAEIAIGSCSITGGACSIDDINSTITKTQDKKNINTKKKQKGNQKKEIKSEKILNKHKKSGK